MGRLRSHPLLRLTISAPRGRRLLALPPRETRSLSWSAIIFPAFLASPSPGIDLFRIIVRSTTATSSPVAFAFLSTLHRAPSVISFLTCSVSLSFIVFSPLRFLLIRRGPSPASTLRVHICIVSAVVLLRPWLCIAGNRDRIVVGSLGTWESCDQGSWGAGIVRNGNRRNPVSSN